MTMAERTRSTAESLSERRTVRERVYKEMAEPILRLHGEGARILVVGFMSDHIWDPTGVGTALARTPGVSRVVVRNICDIAAEAYQGLATPNFWDVVKNFAHTLLSRDGSPSGKNCFIILHGGVDLVPRILLEALCHRAHNQGFTVVLIPQGDPNSNLGYPVPNIRSEVLGDIADEKKAGDGR